MEQKIEIPFSTIARVFSAVLVLWLLYFLRDLLVLIFLAVAVAVLFSPLIDFLERKRVPRFFATLFVYAAFFAILSLIFYFLLPPLIEDLELFFKKFLPQFFEKAALYLEQLKVEEIQDVQQIVASLSHFSKNLFSFLLSIFGGFFDTLFVFSLAFFLSLETKGVQNLFLFFFKEAEKEKVRALLESAESKIFEWFKVRIVGCAFVFLLSLVCFLFLKGNYPFLLALICGIFNFIPFLGPLFSGVLIFLLNLSQGMLAVLFLLAAFLVVQLLENNFLTPYLSKKVFEFSPALTLIFLAVGGKIGGLFGAIFAIPLFAILFEFLKEYQK